MRRLAHPNPQAAPDRDLRVGVLPAGAATDHTHGGLWLSLTNITGGYSSTPTGLSLSLEAASGGGGAATDHTHGGLQLNLTNLTGSYTSQSNGLTLNLAAGAPGGGGGLAVVAGTMTQTAGSLWLTGAGGITVTGNASSAIISFDAHHLDALVFTGNGYGTGFSSMTSGTPSINAVGWLSFSQNGNSLSMSVPVGRNSTDAIGLNTAGTNMTWTVNSSGISINAGAYLTTAAQISHSHGNPTLALTNLTGTTASASNGLTISLAAAAPGAGGGIAASAAGSSQSAGTVVWSNSYNIAFGMNGSTITASAAAAATNHSHGNPTLALTNLTGTTASASNGLTISLSAAAPGGGAAPSGTWFDNGRQDITYSARGSTHGTLLVGPMLVDNNLCPVNMTILSAALAASFGSNASMSAARSYTLDVGFYTRNGISLSLLNSYSTALTNAATSNASASWHGARWLSVQGSQFSGGSFALSANVQYWMGIIVRSAGSSMSMSLIGQHPNATIARWGTAGVSTNASGATFKGGALAGYYTATTAAMPASIGSQQLNGSLAFVPHFVGYNMSGVW